MTSEQYYIRNEDAPPLLSQLERRASLGGSYYIDNRTPLENTLLPSGRVVFRGYQWIKEEDDASDLILRIFDMSANLHPTITELEHLYLVEQPQASILLFDAQNDDMVIKVPRENRYKEGFIIEMVQLKHRDNRRVPDSYVQERLSYEAQQPFDAESEHAQLILCGELDTRNAHPIYRLLEGASKNPAFQGIDFVGSLHWPDHPDSISYPDYGRDKYACRFMFNCSLCNFHQYTIRKFRAPRARQKDHHV